MKKIIEATEIMNADNRQERLAPFYGEEGDKLISVLRERPCDLEEVTIQLSEDYRMKVLPKVTRSSCGYNVSVQAQFFRLQQGQWSYAKRSEIPCSLSSQLQRNEKINLSEFLKKVNMPQLAYRKFDQCGEFSRLQAPSYIDGQGQVFKDQKAILNRGTPLFINKEPLIVKGVEQGEFLGYLKEAFSWTNQRNLSFRFDQGTEVFKEEKVSFTSLDGRVYTTKKEVLKDKYKFANLLLTLFIFNGSILSRIYKRLPYKVIGIDASFKGDLRFTVTNKLMEFVEFHTIVNQEGEAREKHSAEKIFKGIDSLIKSGSLSSKDKVCIHWDGPYLSQNEVWNSLKEKFTSLTVIQIPKQNNPLMGFFDENKELQHCPTGHWGIIEDTGYLVTHDQNAKYNCPRCLVAKRIYGSGNLKLDLEVLWALARGDFFSLFGTARSPTSIRMADKPRLAKMYLRALKNSKGK